jgi:hypothetical protein
MERWSWRGFDQSTVGDNNGTIFDNRSGGGEQVEL